MKVRGDEKRDEQETDQRESQGKGKGGLYEDRILDSRMPTKVISEGPSSLTFGYPQFIVP